MPENENDEPESDLFIIENDIVNNIEKKAPLPMSMLKDELIEMCLNLKGEDLTVVGVTGYKGSGKDTVGDYLVTKYGFLKINFADSLKSACKSIFLFNDEQLYGQSKEIVDQVWGVTPRSILQHVGTVLFRDKLGELIPSLDSKTIWLKNVLLQIRALVQNNRAESRTTKVVICDCRFDNEVEMIHLLGGKVFLVFRESHKTDNLAKMMHQ